MDSLITAAAQALAAGDPIGALKRVALRDDPHALALRGIAMAQLGEFTRARELVRRAARAFGPGEAVARARCVVADAEIALASRNLRWPARQLQAARATLQTHGDLANAAHARYLAIRRLLLLGRVAEVEHALHEERTATLPPALHAIHELMAAGMAMRLVRASAAEAAFARAREAAVRSRIPALQAEIEQARRQLQVPAARLLAQGQARAVSLAAVEALFASPALVVDGCRRTVRAGEVVVPLARRPILFALARTLAAAWPDEAPRAELIARAFRIRRPDETHRARLRVEVARLRRALQPLAEIAATSRGFALRPRQAEVALLDPPTDEAHAPVLAVLADGEAWSTSALALVLGTSQRQVQRTLATLVSSGAVRSMGGGRSRRWLAPLLPGFATALLLPMPLPGD